MTRSKPLPTPEPTYNPPAGSSPRGSELNVRGLILTCVALLMAPYAALAQVQYPVPEMTTVARESIWLEWVIAAVFLVGCLMLAFKPAKRSNLQ